MVRIFSDNSDYSTSKVLEWIQYYNYASFRINEDKSRLKIGLYLDSDKLIINEHEGQSDSSITWFRRGTIENADEFLVPYNVEARTLELLKVHLKDEFKAFSSFYYDLISSIDNPNRYSVNKLNALLEAKNLGLSIPKTLITKCKSDVQKYLGDDFPLICKPITDLLQIEHNNIKRSHLIKYLEEHDIINLPDHFGISLFQKFIDKKYEIRVYCIKNKVYAVANFSNLNNNSKIDGRNIINSEWKINRIVPFLLPPEIERKIILLLEKLGLDSGSFDFLRSKTNEFVFLEVNPVGQFAIVSKFGNYYIEKHIAKILCSNENN